jgi:hypothetical protein
MLTISKTVTGAEPVTLEQVKAYNRVLFDSDDAVLELLITEARETLSKSTGLSLVETEIELVYDRYINSFRLPYGPVTAVTSLELDGEDISGSVAYGMIKRAGRGTIVAEYEAGPAQNEGLRIAMLEMIAHLYTNRGTDKPIPHSVKRWIIMNSLNFLA